MSKFTRSQAGMVAHAFNPSSQDAEVGGSLEIRASLAYILSSRTVRAT